MNPEIAAVLAGERRWCVVEGDCLDVLPTLEPVDAIVCDPPYGLAFMGKEWDHGVPGVPYWTAALNAAKPGAHLLAFGGTRTHHRLMCAIEDAGWEIRDVVMWLYASGFPKSLDVSKAMDKAAGAERTKVGSYKRGMAMHPGNEGADAWRDNYTGEVAITVPATDLAKQWQGWGTALKPAWEPIVLARKPLVGTVAANVAAHGTGALNIDGCRIQCEPFKFSRGATALGRMNDDGWQPKPQSGENHPAGRWPANVALDAEAAAALDAEAGRRTSGQPSGVKTGG